VPSELSQEFLDRFIGWCRGERSVRSVILLGSMARDGAADELSDLDLMIVTTRPRKFSDPEWLDSIDPSPLFTWTYRPPLGGELVHQAIYEGPLVVDIAPLSNTRALLTGLSVEAVFRAPILRRCLPRFSSQLDTWLSVASRGTQVLIDKDGVAIRMVRRSGQGSATRTSPTEGEFLNSVHSLFGLCLWESKQLVRGELWMALGTVDQQVKACLLEMLEWHSIVTSLGTTETWYGGRKVETWADPRWSSVVGGTWPSYDSESAWDALIETMRLFSEVATETARVLGYRYPAEQEQEVRKWIEDRRRGATNS
jgi:predicted nucleotidyltransferase